MVNFPSMTRITDLPDMTLTLAVDRGCTGTTETNKNEVMPDMFITVDLDVLPAKLQTN